MVYQTGKSEPCQPTHGPAQKVTLQHLDALECHHTTSCELCGTREQNKHHLVFDCPQHQETRNELVRGAQRWEGLDVPCWRKEGERLLRRADDKCECQVAQYAAHLMQCPLVGDWRGRRAEETWSSTPGGHGVPPALKNESYSSLFLSRAEASAGQPTCRCGISR